MYIPSHFEEKSVDVMQKAVDELAFGILVTVSEAGIEASHIPFELDTRKGEFGTLLCHVARKNTVWQTVQSATHDSLIIFQGPSTYISPIITRPSSKRTKSCRPTTILLSMLMALSSFMMMKNGCAARLDD